MKKNNDDFNDDLDIVFGRKKVHQMEPEDTLEMKTTQASNPSSKKPKQKKSKTTDAKKLKRQRIIASILIVCVTIGAIGSGGIIIFATNSWKKSPDMYRESFYAMSTTNLLDDKGEIYHKTGLKVADAIEYEDLPQVLVDAFIATEDSRFFKHNGVDIPRFTKAMMINVKDSIKNFRLSFSQGGSTITMQLIKNTFFVSEDVEGGNSNLAASSGIEGVERKMQELYLATKLEQEQLISKKEQIAFYLNSIYFGAGNNTMGIQSSANRYFDKDVSELNLVESAFLAGVINAPNSYSPYQSIQKAKDRTHTILDLMKLHGYITADEHAVASAVKLENIFVDRSQSGDESLEFQAYIDLVHEEIVEVTGHSLTATPMNVYTHMNSNIQKGIEKVQRREIDRINPGSDSFMQMGSAVVENGTGAIVGVFGGYDYDTRLAFNRARDAKAQPASVIKAVLSYPLAFEHLGISSEHILTDAPYVYGGMTPDKGQVNNYDNKYLGDIDLNLSFAESRNTTAIRLLEDIGKKIGNDGIMAYLKSIGITDIDGFNISYAIGGGEMLATPLQLAEALSTIMNDGIHIKPTTISKVEYINGQDSIDNIPKQEQVLDPASAYLTTNLMWYAVNGPYPGYTRVLKRSYPVYGKTGTNGWSKEMTQKFGIPEGTAKNRNLFTSTDRFSIATWIGFDDEKPEHKPWVDNRLTQMNITGYFNGYVLDLLADEFGPGKAVQRPSDVVDITHIKGPFPYQRPIDGMRSDMIVTGQINKKHLSLVDPEPQSLETLKEATVESSQLGNRVNVNMTFTPYPDETKLTIAPDTREMPLRGSDKVYIGRRLYDDSWLYGAVEYVVDVVIDGKVVDTLRSSKPKLGTSVNVPKGSKLSLCGYYGYSNSTTVMSNKICHDIETKNNVGDEPAASLTLPRINERVANFKVQAAQNNLKVNVLSENNADINEFGKIVDIKSSDDVSLSGKTMSLEDLKKDTLTLILKDFEYDVSNPNLAMTQEEFYTKFKDIIQIKKPKDEDKGNIITGFNGGETKIKMLDYYTKNLTLK